MRSDANVSRQMISGHHLLNRDRVGTLTDELSVTKNNNNKMGSTEMNISYCIALPDTTDKVFTFSNGRQFPTSLVFSLTQQIKTRAPLLVPGCELTLRKICGNDYWLYRMKYAPTEAGECALCLCADRYVPLIDTEDRNTANHHLYRVM